MLCFTIVLLVCICKQISLWFHPCCLSGLEGTAYNYQQIYSLFMFEYPPATPHYIHKPTSQHLGARSARSTCHPRSFTDFRIPSLVLMLFRPGTGFLFSICTAHSTLESCGAAWIRTSLSSPAFVHLMGLNDRQNCNKFSLCICAILNLLMLLWVLLLYRYFLYF